MRKGVLAAAAAVACVLWLSSCSDNRFRRLDAILGQEEDIDARVRRRTDSLTLLFNAAGPDSLRFRFAEQLYDEWRHLNLDSCNRYTDEMLRYAGSDSSRILSSRAALVRTLTRRGDLSGAVEVFKSLRIPSQASESDIDTYFYIATRLVSQLNRTAIDSLLSMKALADDYLSRSGPTYKTLLFKVKELRYYGNPDEALDVVKSIPVDEIADVHYRSTYYMSICSIYIEKDDPVSAMDWCVKSAECDLGSGMKDYFSLYLLARLLFKEGDTERAVRYMNRAVRDALIYNYPLGMQRSVSTLNYMNAAIFDLHRRQRIFLWLGILLISLFLLIALVLLFINSRMLRRVRRVNNMYRQSQSELRSVSLIKDHMLGEYMGLASNYIYEVDERRSAYRKMLKEEGPEALARVFREPSFADSEFPRYCDNFDKIFLEIFPDFIEKLNVLMPDGAKFEKTPEGGLTSQLRILALIRLGICDSFRISVILHISKGTVYTYRSVMRQSALVPDTFEDDVQGIGIL